MTLSKFLMAAALLTVTAGSIQAAEHSDGQLRKTLEWIAKQVNTKGWVPLPATAELFRGVSEIEKDMTFEGCRIQWTKVTKSTDDTVTGLFAVPLSEVDVRTMKVIRYADLPAFTDAGWTHDIWLACFTTNHETKSIDQVANGKHSKQSEAEFFVTPNRKKAQDVAEALKKAILMCSSRSL